MGSGKLVIFFWVELGQEGCSLAGTRRNVQRAVNYNGSLDDGGVRSTSLCIKVIKCEETLMMDWTEERREKQWEDLSPQPKPIFQGVLTAALGPSLMTHS